MAIRTFAHEGVEEVFLTGRSRRIGPQFRRRMILLLDALNAATNLRDLVGIRVFHALLGNRPGTFAMSVTANRRLTFCFEHGTTGDILDVNFEDDH